MDLTNKLSLSHFGSHLGLSK